MSVRVKSASYFSAFAVLRGFWRLVAGTQMRFLTTTRPLQLIKSWRWHLHLSRMIVQTSANAFQQHMSNSTPWNLGRWCLLRRWRATMNCFRT